MVNKIDYGEFILNTAITNSSTLASISVTARYTEHDLTKDRATGLLTAGAITLTNPTDLGQKEKIYFSNATADGTDASGRAKYILTVDTADDASTKRRGTANDDDGTDAVANVISGNMYAFPKNSPARITWDVGELTALETTFTAGTTTNTAEAGEDIEALDSVSLHTDGKLYEYHSTNYPNLVGAVSTAYLTGVTATYTTFGGVSTGHSGLTIGATQYAEDTGTITETSSTTTTLLGTAETATTIRIAKAGDTTTEFNDNVFKIKDNSDATKIAAFEASGITTATTRTYTLPDESGTILTDQGFDIPDNSFNIVDDGDNTKKIAFQASGITTATTRTLTVPDKDGTIATISDLSLSKKVHSFTSDTTVSNTTDETSIASFTLTGGSLSTNNVVKFKVYFDNFDLNSSHTATFNCKYGTTTVATCSWSQGSVDPSNKNGYIEFVLFAAGSTSSQQGFVSVSTHGAGDAAGTSSSSGFGSSSESSTSDKTVDITVDFSAASSSTKITSIMGYAELIQA
jgi:hypothetical protein